MSGLTSELSLLSNIFNNFSKESNQDRNLIIIDGLVKNSSYLENTALSVSLIENMLSFSKSFSLISSNDTELT